MSKFRMHGITSVEMGEMGADGVMGANLKEVGAIVNDTVVFSIEEPEIARIKIEGTDDPDILAIQSGGAKTLKFQTRDFDPETIARIMGGTVTSGKYSAPVNSKTKIWQSVKITGDIVDGEKAVLEIPKALIYAKMTGNFQMGESGILEVTCEIGTPESALGVASSPYSLNYVHETP